MYEIEEYITEDGTSPFAEWLEGTQGYEGADAPARPLGNLGDWTMLSDAEGVAELRDHYGPGYRVYFGFVGRRVILLLCGSTKRDQKKAIKRARAYWTDYHQRTGR